MTSEEQEKQERIDKAIKMWNELRQRATDVPELTLEEINEEIAAVRRERRNKQQ